MNSRSCPRTEDVTPPAFKPRATFVLATFAAFVLLAPPLAGLAGAQERPRPTAEFETAWVGFADDGVVGEGLIGGAARWYLSPRVSVGPEVVFIAGQHHSHLVITGNATWDLMTPTNSRPSITPFFVVGGGVFQTRETFFTGSFTSSEGAFTAGGGVRAAVGDRVTIAVDARIGWELHLRVGGVLGVRLGR